MEEDCAMCREIIKDDKGQATRLRATMRIYWYKWGRTTSDCGARITKNRDVCAVGKERRRGFTAISDKEIFFVYVPVGTVAWGKYDGVHP